MPIGPGTGGVGPGTGTTSPPSSDTSRRLAKKLTFQAGTGTLLRDVYLTTLCSTLSRERRLAKRVPGTGSGGWMYAGTGTHRRSVYEFAECTTGVSPSCCAGKPIPKRLWLTMCCAPFGSQFLGGGYFLQIPLDFEDGVSIVNEYPIWRGPGQFWYATCTGPTLIGVLRSNNANFLGSFVAIDPLDDPDWNACEGNRRYYTFASDGRLVTAYVTNFPLDVSVCGIHTTGTGTVHGLCPPSTGTGTNFNPAYALEKNRGLAKYVLSVDRNVFLEACCPTGTGTSRIGVQTECETDLVPRTLNVTLSSDCAAANGQSFSISYIGFGDWRGTVVINGQTVTLDFNCSGGVWTVFMATSGGSPSCEWNFNLTPGGSGFPVVVTSSGTTPGMTCCPPGSSLVVTVTEP